MSTDAGSLHLSDQRRLGLARNIPALALAVAAGLHLAALPDHAGQGPAVAGLFLAAAVFQLAAALLVGLGRATDTTRLGIVAGNIVLVALWAWSRTAGLPLGDHAGPEAVSLLDGLAVAMELTAIAALCISRDVARVRRGGLASGALLSIMVLTGAGALQWLPATHAAHGGRGHDATHQQEDQHGPVHPTTQHIATTPPPDTEHSGTGVTAAPCPNACEGPLSKPASSHDDTEHTHP